MSVVTVTRHFVDVMSLAGVIISMLALVALLRRTRLSVLLGRISIVCHVIAFIAVVINWQRLPGVSELKRLGLLLAPGVVAIVFNRPPPPIPPGHCTTCGYNLTGNVSGKCSECGAPVIAP